MNKFSELLNESLSFEEVEDYIIPISDILGKAEVATINFGDKAGYIFKWRLKFNLDEYNGSEQIDEIQKIIGFLNDISDAQTRIKNFDVEFKINTHLFVRFTPHPESKGEDYNYIVGQNWRNIIIDYGQIAQFFKSHGYSIKNTKVEDNEYEESSSVYIVTDAPDYVTSQFKDDFLSEFNSKYIDEESINRRLSCTNNGGVVYIFPEDEKTFVIFNQQI